MLRKDGQEDIAEELVMKIPGTVSQVRSTRHWSDGQSGWN